MTLYMIGFLVGGALVGGLIGAVVAGVMRRRMRYWMTGGILVGLAVAFVGLSDRAGPERDAQVLYDECLRGFTQAAPPGVTGGEDYCSCVARKFETDEGGFRTAFESLTDQLSETEGSQATIVAMSNEVIARETQACLGPVLVGICTRGQESLRDDAAYYCRCAVEGIFGLEGGMAILAEKMVALSDPQSFANDPDIQAALQACELSPLPGSDNPD